MHMGALLTKQKFKNHNHPIELGTNLTSNATFMSIYQGIIGSKGSWGYPVYICEYSRDVYKYYK